MNANRTRKMTIHLLMTALLLFLTAYPITGQALHEWLGIGMLLLFLVHNLFHIRWYGNLRKGTYSPQRLLQTLLPFCLSLSLLCLGYSGIILSRHVFAALPVHGPLATARALHMAASCWTVVLIGIHLGMHWGRVAGRFRKLLQDRKLPNVSARAIQLAAICLAGYGLLCFIQKDMLAFMLLQKQLIFSDFAQSALSTLVQSLAIMSFWIFAGFQIVRAVGSPTGRNRYGKTNRNLLQ